jgi:2,3-dihydroxybenzoate-AMP ligase
MTVSVQLGAFPTYPHDVVARYRSAGLWGDKSIPDEFRAVAARHPLNDAVVDRDRRLTYAELDASTDAIAGGLLEAGLEAGDRVTLQVGNTVGTIELIYGLLKAGLIPVCTLAAHGHHEVDAIATSVQARAHAIDLRDKTSDRVAFAHEVRDRVSSVRHLIQVSEGPAAPGAEGFLTLDDLRRTDAGVAGARLSAVAGSIDPDGLAVMQLSGGTSGTPKLIPRLHAEYWYNGKATATRWGVTPEDRMAHVIPIVHNAGMHGALWPAHSTGATLVLEDLSRGLDVFTTLVREKVTGMMMLPTFLKDADHPLIDELVHSLRWMSMSGAKVPEAVFDRLQAAGVIVGQNFGMTEGIILVTPLDSPEAVRRHTVGSPLSAWDEVRIVDPDDPSVERPLGVPGELIARGPYTIRGYFDAAEHNARAFTRDGFYRTGDVMTAVEIDGLVVYRVEGRIKDVIDRGGEKINASEVEGLLLSHPRIELAAVVPMPDERLGERACAYVVSADGESVTLEDIRAHLQALEVAKYKWPERIETVSALPRTAVGKISKRELAAQIAATIGDERHGVR